MENPYEDLDKLEKEIDAAISAAGIDPKNAVEWATELAAAQEKISVKQSSVPDSFAGSHNAYKVIGVRGNNKLALSMSYEIHPQGTGCFLIRFVSTDVNDVKFTTFKAREKAEFQGESKFIALRLNKIAVPVFHPAPPPTAFMEFADKYLIWDIVGDWISSRVTENGFTVIGDMKEVVKILVSGAGANDEHYKLVLAFPDKF